MILIDKALETLLKIQEANNLTDELITTRAGLPRNYISKLRKDLSLNFTNLERLVKNIGGNVYVVIEEPLTRELASLLIANGDKFYKEFYNTAVIEWKNANDDANSKAKMAAYPLLKNFVNAAKIYNDVDLVTVVWPSTKQTAILVGKTKAPVTNDYFDAKAVLDLPQGKIAMRRAGQK